MKYDAIVGFVCGLLVAAPFALVAAQELAFDVSSTTPDALRFSSQETVVLYEQNEMILDRLESIEKQVQWLRKYR